MILPVLMARHAVTPTQDLPPLDRLIKIIAVCCLLYATCAKVTVQIAGLNSLCSWAAAKTSGTAAPPEYDSGGVA